LEFRWADTRPCRKRKGGRKLGPTVTRWTITWIGEGTHLGRMRFDDIDTVAKDEDKEKENEMIEVVLEFWGCFY
jgi:hypothetical protein